MPGVPFGIEADGPLEPLRRGISDAPNAGTPDVLPPGYFGRLGTERGATKNFAACRIQAHRNSRCCQPEVGSTIGGDRAIVIGCGENGADGSHSVVRASRRPGEVLGDDEAIVVLHGRRGFKAQDLGNRRRRGSRASQLCPEAVAERRRTDDCQHGQRRVQRLLRCTISPEESWAAARHRPKQRPIGSVLCWLHGTILLFTILLFKFY